MNKKKLHPPRFTSWLVKRLSIHHHRQMALGDIEEMYFELREANGKKHADSWYRRHCLKSVPRLLKNLLYWSYTMSLHYLVIALRHFARNKSYTVINITGLSLGIAIFILISAYVKLEYSYDNFHENADSIYRVNRISDTSLRSTESSLVPLKLGYFIKKDYPEIEKLVRFYIADKSIVQYNDQTFLEDRFYFADPTYFDMFDFDLLKGDKNTVLHEPNALVISEEAAKKYFGSDDPIGKILSVTIQYWGTTWDFTIRGVLKDPPKNTHIQLDFLAPFARWEKITNQNGSAPNSAQEVGWLWTWNAYSAYVQLSRNVDPGQLESKFPDFVRRYFPERLHEVVSLSLVPLEEIHLNPRSTEMFVEGVSPVKLLILLGLALSVLFVAAINFANLNLVKSFNRGKEIGVRKVIGATRKQLVKQYLFETNLLSFFSVLVGLGLSYFMAPYFGTLVGKSIDINIAGEPVNILILFVTALLLGLLSGGYPSVILSRFSPAAALKKKLGLKHSAQFSGLVVVQFCVAIALLTGTYFVFSQMNYIFERDMGFDKTNIAFIDLASTSDTTKYATFINELESHSNILGATTTTSKPGATVWHAGFDLEDHSEKFPPVAMVTTDPGFFEVYDVTLLSGEGPEHFSAGNLYYINDRAAKAMGFEDPLGKTISNVTNFGGNTTGRIAGVFKDFQLESLYTQVAPAVIRVVINRTRSLGFITVKLKGENVPETLSYIEKTFKSIYPALPYNLTFLDEELNNIYRADMKLMEILTNLSIAAIIISCLGLYALTSYIVGKRAKEIAIRKVVGASVTKLVYLLGADILVLIVISNVLAIPVIYLSISRWLDNFAYRIQLDAATFILSTLIIIGVAAMTIAYQTIKTALRSPLTTIRTE